MRLSSLLSVFLLSVASIANAVAAEVPPPPTLAVKAYVLRAYNSDEVIAAENANERVEPASLTKIMTAYMVFKAVANGHLKLNQVLPVSTKAWKAEGSRMFIEPNKPVTVDELLHGLIIQSGNDAAIALAEGVAGSEETFAAMMNKEMAAMGLKDTHFVNSTGLPDPEHYTTAHDLSLMASALVRDFPDDYKRFYSTKEYTYNKITQPNRNRLLWLDPNVDGMKTGHTQAAGYCLVTSAKRDNMRLISVVLGAPSDSARATESQKLLNYGFLLYESRLVYKHGQPVSKLKVWKGHNDVLAATVAEDVYLTLPKGEYSRVKATITSKQPLIAPIKAGQEIGTIKFTLGDKLLEQRKLVASEDVEIAGMFGRLWDSIKLQFE